MATETDKITQKQPCINLLTNFQIFQLELRSYARQQELMLMHNIFLQKSYSREQSFIKNGTFLAMNIYGFIIHVEQSDKKFNHHIPSFAQKTYIFRHKKHREVFITQQEIRISKLTISTNVPIQKRKEGCFQFRGAQQQQEVDVKA